MAAINPKSPQVFSASPRKGSPDEDAQSHWKAQEHRPARHLQDTDGRPLVNVYITMENHHFEWEKHHL